MREWFIKCIEVYSRHFPAGGYAGFAIVFIVGAIVLLAVLGARRGLRWSAVLLLVEYLVLILWLAVLARSVQAERMHNFTPFWSYHAIPKDVLVLPQIILNVAVFIPVGVLLRCAFEKMRWWKVLLVGGAFSVIIEVLQFVTKRGFAEFDDVFHNTLGCLLGYGLFVAAAWVVRRLSDKRVVV